ncbi:MAG: folylpolyglutamate synthase/dihydrofolate synthase family protein [Saprospiraceae bacterium]
MKIKTYPDALKYMYEKLPMFQRMGAAAYKKDLTNTILLCESIGNPQNRIKTIHIAGTNGKGTTTHIIAGGLQAQGYKVGVYTSPHYKDFRERIKINGIYIPKKYVQSFITSHQSIIEEIQPSFFELTVALAFKYFADEQVDYAVIETGLGGRLDSTNIITPLISVITNISFDHQEMLGHTLEAIAGEKAGIIKSGVPVIIGEKQHDISHVFEKKAQLALAPLKYADEIVQMNKNGTSELTSTYQVKSHDTIWLDDLKVDILGPFLEKNLVTGLSVLHFLSKSIDIDPRKIESFFPKLAEKTKYMGRWQIIGHSPMILADSAHNEGGISVILKALEKIKYNNLHIVLGFVRDKDLAKLLSMFPKDATYYFAKANIPRGLDAITLSQQAAGYELNGESYKSVRRALAVAKKRAGVDDMIFIGGSIFVVAEIL